VQLRTGLVSYKELSSKK